MAEESMAWHGMACLESLEQQGGEDFLRSLAEVSNRLGAGKHERSEGREGYRERPLHTRRAG